MPQTPKNTDYDKRDATPNIRGVLDAHKRLFGEGAKVSGPIRIVDQYGHPSLDEQAWAARPKSFYVGKDISLPSIRKRPATKPASPKKR